MKLHMLPCYGCGRRRTVDIFIMHFNDDQLFYVTCYACGKVGGERHSREDAIKIWNAAVLQSQTKKANKRKRLAARRRA